MKKILLFVLLFVVAAILASITHPAIGIIAGLVASGIYTIFVEDALDGLKVWLNVPIKTSELTIFLYGRGGSGKTTFIKSIISLEELNNRYHKSTSTRYIEYFKGMFYFSPNVRKRFSKKYLIPMHIADYKGQAPRQALELKKNFLSQVNALIFIVDVIHPDPKSEGNAMGTQDLVKWLASDTEEKINDRIIEHVAYIGDAILSVIFSNILTVNKGKLRSVRLIINKIDIIHKLMSKGYLAQASSSGLSAEDYVLKKFRPIEKYITDACRQNGIPDWEVTVVSLTEGEGVRVLKSLVSSHFEALGIR